MVIHSYPSLGNIPSHFISGNISGSCFDSQSQGIQILLQWVRPQRLDQFHCFSLFSQGFWDQFAVPTRPLSSILASTHSGWISEKFFRISGGSKDHPCGKRGGHDVVGGGAREPACALGMLGENFQGDWSFSHLMGLRWRCRCIVI